MLTVRRSHDRGHAHHGWLESYHSFSFADYFDPRHMGFRTLRVINEDRVAPGGGFPTHGHRDMEIVSYVLDGGLEHKDSLGTGSIIKPGDVQRMSAGSGVRHSEFNASKTEPVHFLQIWIQPSRPGVPPSYEQRHFPREEKLGRLRLVASPDGADGSVPMSTDARLYVTILGPGQSVTVAPPTGRHTYLYVARGDAVVGGTVLGAGDAASCSDEPLTLQCPDGAAESEVLVFELP